MNNKVMSTGIKLLDIEDFYIEEHQQIFQAMCRLASSSRPINLSTLEEDLEIDDELESVGGAAYLATLTDG